MTNGPFKAVVVVTATALVCSILVTVAAVTMQPIQRAYQDLERNRYLVAISGLTDDATELSDREVISVFQALDARIVNLDTGTLDDTYNPGTFDTWKAASDPAFSVAIPTDQDIAKLSRRSRFITIYLVTEGNNLSRMILPIYGQGMWSTLYGFIALEADLNTIADITFYDQAETAGIGDKILREDWQARWRGQKLFDEAGTLRFAISKTSVDPSSLAAAYHVDAISGATITTDAVSSLVRYWFGPHGFAPFLQSYRAEARR